MSLTSEITSIILERVDRRDIPRQYMILPRGFRFGSTGGPALVLSHIDQPETTVQLGAMIRGTWCLELGWRDRVKDLVHQLHMETVTTYTDEVDF